MKALIAVSVSREWTETDFLQQMGKWVVPEEWQLKIGWFRQFTAAERHNVAMFEARYNYDRVLFMDTDQIYPFDYLAQMLSHKEPVVSGINVSRYDPFEVTTYKIDGETANDGVVVPRFVAVEPPHDRKIFECDGTGTGALMINPNIIEKLELPLFKDIFISDGTIRVLPDDFYFCWQLHKAGIKITVDQNIIVTHLAKMLVNVFNRRDIKNASDKISTGWGIVKDGEKA